MHEIIILAVNADIIIARACSYQKRLYFYCIEFCDYIANSLKLHALSHADTPNED